MTLECLDFTRYPHNTTFGQHFTRGWFTFTALGPRDPIVSDRGVHGLQFTWEGLQIDLPFSTSISLRISTSGQPLVLVALDSAGQVVDTQTVPPDRQVHHVTFNGSNIRRVVITGSDESRLVSLCIPTATAQQQIDDAADRDKIDDAELEKILSDPAGEAALARLKREILEEEERRQKGGGGGGFSIDWPPDWWCVARNLAWIAGGTVVVGWLANLFGVAVIGALAEAELSAILIQRFALSAKVIEVVIWLVRGGTAVGLALHWCSPSETEAM